MVYTIRPALIIIDIQNGFVSPGGSFGKLGYDTSRYQEIVPIAQDLPSLDEVWPELENELRQQRISQVIDRLINELTDKAKIEVFL